MLLSSRVILLALLVFLQVVHSSYIDSKIIKYQNENNLSGPITVPLTDSYRTPPAIINETKDIWYIHVEQRLELPCMANGNPKPIYYWNKNGIKMDLNSTLYKGKVIQDVGVGTLKFLRPTGDDVGEYQCFAETKGLGKSVSKINHVYKAELSPFLREETKYMKRLVGKSLVLECEPPKGTPKPIISWNILISKVDSTKPVKLNKRISMDYSGNLYFANVRKEDYQNADTYVCSAQSTFLRILGQGFDHVIQPEEVGGGSIKQPVQLMWASKSKVTVLNGDTLKMKCIFSGNPTPTVTWKRVNGKIDTRRREGENNDLELIINKVEYDDAGMYECIGDNEVTKGNKSHTFTVSVESRPYWVEEPKDMTKGVEETVTFSCLAFGKPKPKVSWFINGEPFEPDPSDRTEVFKDNTLSYYNLTEKDSRVIQCNASNANGYIWADFYLNVLAIPPSFKRNVPELTKVAEKSVVIIPCIAYGKPTPFVSWFRGEQLIKSKRHEILPSGSLKINGVEEFDSGEYTCRARNRFGTESSSGELAVRTRTVIVEAPDDMVVMVGKTALFTCHASTDSYEINNLEIFWYKNDTPVDTNDPNINQEANNNLIISNLQNKDSGNYTCVASNGLDNDTKSAELKVKGPPDPPIDIKVICTVNTADITWKEGRDNFSPITHYIIEFKTSFNYDWHEDGHTTNKIEEWQTGLTPWSNYTFRVKGVNELGTGAPSEPASNMCTTGPDIPASHPAKVKTETNKRRYLVVVWKKMSPLEYNGPGFRYVVKITKENNTDTDTYIVDGSELARKEILTNTTYEPYTISVSAKNDLGYANGMPEEITGYSGEDTPLEAPKKFEQDPDHDLKAESAKFHWDPVSKDQETIRGVFMGYKILYWKRDQRETTLKKIDVPENSPTDHRIRRSRHRRQSSKVKTTVTLPAYSELSLSVVARNNYYESPESNIINVTTPEGVPGKVRSFMALVRGSGHFHLKWEAPEEHNGVLLRYEIGYQKINGLKLSSIQYENTSKTDPSMTEYLLSGLEHSTNYRVHIWALTRAGRGKPYYIDVWTTNDSKPIIPVWTMTQMGNNSLNVSWEIDYNKTNQHVGLMHVVQYKKLGESNYISTQGQMLNRWQNVSNLTAGIWYQFRVVAQSGDQTEKSDWKRITLPNPNPDITISRGKATQDLTSATWFIAMMVAIALLILILIIVCIAKRNREAKYDVQQEERLRGHDPHGTDDHFNDSKNDENGIGKPGALINGDKASGISDSDSLGDYGDVDPGKFNEDGSFIGQYGTQDKKEASEAAAPSAMSTFV